MTNLQIKRYEKQAFLCLRVLGFCQSTPFALKGGTAINYFIRSLPRLSVDIDFAYCHVGNRKKAMSDISNSLKNVVEKLKRGLPGCKILEVPDDEGLSKLQISYKDSSIKIEVNKVKRGTVYPFKERDIQKDVENEFELTLSFPILAFAELYGEKICAALDRQHPRDFFDIKLLLEKEGLTPEIRQAFIAYLISSPRPMHELINPNKIDIKTVYESQFKGLARLEVSLGELIETREQLIKIINDSLEENEKQFILSIQENKPKWDLLPLNNLKDLPAIKWKLLNIAKMEKVKHSEQTRKLIKALGL